MHACTRDIGFLSACARAARRLALCIAALPDAQNEGSGVTPGAIAGGASIRLAVGDSAGADVYPVSALGVAVHGTPSRKRSSAASARTTHARTARYPPDTWLRSESAEADSSPLSGRSLENISFCALKRLRSMHVASMRKLSDGDEKSTRSHRAIATCGLPSEAAVVERFNSAVSCLRCPAASRPGLQVPCEAIRFRRQSLLVRVAAVAHWQDRADSNDRQDVPIPNVPSISPVNAVLTIDGSAGGGRQRADTLSLHWRRLADSTSDAWLAVAAPVPTSQHRFVWLSAGHHAVILVRHAS
eukprot:6196138-Pleurochrysis_carterae.AAC.4